MALRSLSGTQASDAKSLRTRTRVSGRGWGGVGGARRSHLKYKEKEKILLKKKIKSPCFFNEQHQVFFFLFSS